MPQNRGSWLLMVRKQGNQPPNSNARFLTTRWSLVLAAGGKADSHCHEALQALCEAYWYPLYAYARHQGQAAQDAEDLTQAFFVKLIERNLVSIADRSRANNKQTTRTRTTTRVRLIFSQFWQPDFPTV